MRRTVEDSLSRQFKRDASAGDSRGEVHVDGPGQVKKEGARCFEVGEYRCRCGLKSRTNIKLQLSMEYISITKNVMTIAKHKYIQLLYIKYVKSYVYRFICKTTFFLTRDIY
jgi:hypothetical protein